VGSTVDSMAVALMTLAADSMTLVGALMTSKTSSHQGGPNESRDGFAGHEALR